MKILIEAKKETNYLTTTAIGKDYYQTWYEYVYPTWKRYCNEYGIGLIIFDEDIDNQDNEHYKNGAWQKLLIGDYILNHNLNINNVCFLDTDILISPYSPNIFDCHNDEKIGVVSELKKIPYQDIDLLKRKIAFGRHHYYDKDYPLDSSLFMTNEQLWNYFDLPVKDDYFCSGVFVFNVKKHSKHLKEWYNKYKQHDDKLGNWDETFFNHEVQSSGFIQWLDYRFQALWCFEVVYKYPFLYNFGRYNNDLIRECIEASLGINYFLHFSGFWHDGKMYKQVKVFNDEKLKDVQLFKNYLKTPVTGEPKGKQKPKVNA